VCHDMDGIDDEKMFDDIIEFERAIGVKSTMFISRHQLKFKNALKKAVDLGFELGLHNTLRPYLNFDMPYNIPYIGHFSVSKFTEKFYAHLLKKELSAFRKLGVEVKGFAPHGVSCYLFSDLNTDWDIIENAALSCDKRILWARGYRSIIKVDNGNEFGRPIPLYWRIRGKSRKLVITVSWDDKFFFPSWEESTFYGGKITYDEDKALKSIYPKLAFCKQHNIPFVINLHPAHWLKGAISTDRLLEKISSYCKRIRCPVYTFSELYELIVK
jgi:hypothetical protein